MIRNAAHDPSVDPAIGTNLADATGARIRAERSPVGLVLRGSLPVPVRELVGLLAAGHDAGSSPVMVTEVDGPASTSVVAAVAALRPGAVLGTAIVPLGSRSAAALAMEATTAAALTGTEFLLGVGVSSPQIVSGWHGLEHDASVATTRERLVELRRLLDGEGRGAFALRGAARAHVRVLLGTLGPRMQELAYEVSDGTILNLMPPSGIVRPPADRRCLAIVWTLCGPGAERSARRELISYALARPYAAHLQRLGFGAVVEEVGRLREAGRLKDAPRVLPDELLELLFASPSDLEVRLDALRATGAQPLVLPLPGPGTIEEVVEEVHELLGRLREWNGRPLAHPGR